MALIYIADGANSNVGLLHEFPQPARTLIADADESHHYLVARRFERLCFGGHRRPVQRIQSGARSERPDECSPGYFGRIHFEPPSVSSAGGCSSREPPL